MPVLHLFPIEKVAHMCDAAIPQHEKAAAAEFLCVWAS